MTNRENDERTEYGDLTWVSKKRWGSGGRTHYTQVLIRGEQWKFTVDLPKKGGPWAFRGWKDNVFSAYGEHATLAETKAAVQAAVNRARGE